MIAAITRLSTPWPPHTRQLRIGDVRIDLRYRRVLRPDAEVELPHRVFELLLLFAAEPHALHTRADLLQRIWSGLIVEDANVSQSVSMVRKALGEERKEWIRTVAKSGYVFEPPTAVEAIQDSAPAARVAEAAPPLLLAPQRWRVLRRLSEPLAKTALPRWTRRVALGALLLIVVAGTFWVRESGRATAWAPLSVTLLDVEDPGAAADARWPASLLHAWLEWKLSVLPEVTVLTQAHLAADASAQTSTQVVLLASGPVADDPKRIFLRARFEREGAPHQLEVEGPPERLAELVDTLSARVLEQLLPARAGQAWPALKVDAPTARRYVDMLRARQARHWVEAANAGRAVVARAPDFALARLQLAQTLATLFEAHAAQEHATAARAQLTPLPADAAQVVDAQVLALTPSHAAAATAFAELSARYPTQAAFAQDHARALMRAGRWAEGLAVLSKPLWDQQPVGAQITRLNNRAVAELALGDPARARMSAREANRLAQAAGPGWELERGVATLLLAQVDTRETEGHNDTALYEAAARHFETAGDSMRALRARFLAETSRPMTTSSAHLDALLAQARAAGFHQLEIEALRIAAGQQYLAGELVAYRARLEQAMAVADAIGDDWGHGVLEVDLLNEDFLGGSFVSVEQRLARLQQNDMQGEMARSVDQFAAVLAFRRGRYADALAMLDRGEQRAQAGRASNDPAPAATAMFACTRAAVTLIQGDPTRARAMYSRCAEWPPNKLLSELGVTEIELLTGDREAAVRGLRRVREALPAESDLPSRWQLSLDLAALLTRAGEIEMSDELYAELLPLLRAANYRLLEAQARVGMAENAMAHAELPVAQAHAEAASSLLSPGDWILRQRMDMLEIAMARASGDTESARLIEFDRAAHRRGDVLAQLLAHSLMSPSTTTAVCSHADRVTLVGRSGLRGATQAWLMQPDATKTVPLLSKIE